MTEVRPDKFTRAMQLLQRHEYGDVVEYIEEQAGDPNE